MDNKELKKVIDSADDQDIIRINKNYLLKLCNEIFEDGRRNC